MMLVRRDITDDQWKWMVRLCQHEADSIPADIEAQLSKLGLANGGGLTGDAKTLVEHELLAERRNRLQAERH
jgi:hypothetical protein